MATMLKAEGEVESGGQAIPFLARLIVLCFLAVVSMVAIPAIQAHGGNERPSSERPPSRSDVGRAIVLATDYLERACGPDGKFTYRVDTDSGRESSSYDIIRHAGAIYALAMSNRSHHDPQAVEAMIRAAAFLRRNYIGSGVRPGQLAVWSKPVAQRSGPRQNYAELGGTGLGLVALAAVRQVDPKLVPLEDLQALGRFALFLQRDDGSFVHKYRAESGPVPDWDSLYYPGEAALGFVALYEADHSSEWLAAATKALLYLANSRAGRSSVPADHWALIATARLLPYCKQNGCAATREELVRHAIQICNSILREQFRSSGPTALDGAFDPTGRTAPAATRLEGLLAALEFLPKDELGVQEKIEVACSRGIGFLLRQQLGSGPYEGGIPGAFYGGSEIRVDYVQHSLCAWLRYQRLLHNEEYRVLGDAK